MTKREYQLRGVDRATRKTYLWEDQWWHWNNEMFRTKTKDAKDWIKWAARRWKVPVPKLYRLPATAKSSYTQPWLNTIDKTVDHHEIFLAPKHNNMAIALHEMAHVIDDYYNKPTAPPHNKRWLGIYLDLLIHSGAYPKAAIVASAHAAGLKWEGVAPPKRKARKKRAS